MFLQLKHVTVTHTKDLRVLIDDFSFTLGPGDKIAIIGEEGNGKSTLLQLMAGAGARPTVKFPAKSSGGDGLRICRKR